MDKLEVLRWRVGRAEITRVGELVTAVPRRVLLPDVTPEHLEENADWLGPYFTDGLLELSFQTFVIRSAGVTIIVDTCLGDDPVRRVPGDSTFPDRVAAEVDGGLEAVDLVLCTHLHFDHVGWNTQVVEGRRVPTFPSARYLFTRAELDFLLEDDHHEIREADVQPLLDAGLVDLIEPAHELTGEVRTFATPGHSPGHVSVLIESAGERAVITGDAVHSPIQFRHPEIAATPFDWDTEMSSDTRRRFIADHVDTDVLVLGTHFAPPTAGRIRTRDDGVWFDSLGSGQEFAGVEIDGGGPS